MSSLISQTRCLLFLLRVDNPAMFLAMYMCTVKSIDLFLIRLHVLRCPYSIFCSSTLYNDFDLGLLKVTESWVAVFYVFLRNPLNKFGATSEYWPSKDSIDVPKGILPISHNLNLVFIEINVFSFIRIFSISFEIKLRVSSTVY